MTDLAILVPSRGRPANVARLVEACEKTCRTNYVLMLGFDKDDALIPANLTAAKSPKALPVIEPRMGLAAWTNHLCGAVISGDVDVPYLASLGDDMVPVTDGWDEQLTGKLERDGPGFAYPQDYRRTDLPEACVISTPIVRALGWMMLPRLDHWYVDNVWADLGNANGCLFYLSDVIVKHHHPNVDPLAKGDATYHEAARKFNDDAAAYRKWRLYGMGADIKTVGQVRAGCSKLPG